MTRNMIRLFCFIFMCLICFSGCSEPTLSETEVIASLPDDIKTIYIDDMPHLLDVASIEVEKRKTDEDLDEIHCTIVMENGTYRNTINTILTYTYYDEGGWILDYCDTITSSVEALEAQGQEELDSELELYYFDLFTFKEQHYNKDAQTASSTYSVEYASNNYSYSGTVTLESVFISDWFSGSWIHELQYDNAFEWNIAGTWAAGDGDLQDLTSFDSSDAFVLYIDMNAISPQNEITFSATAYETISSLFSTEKWRARDVDDYCTQMYMVNRNIDDSYNEPTWRIDFYIEDRDYSIKISPSSLQLLEHDKHLGKLQKGYVIAVSTNSYGWPIYEKVSA